MAHYQQTEKLYAKRASFYERFFVNSLGWGTEIETFFRKSNYLGPRSKILDVGCGTGIATRAVSQLAREKGYSEIVFHAFDQSPEMLAIFHQWIDEQGIKNIEAKQADVLEIENLPSDWNKYDLIVSSTMLEYLPKQRVKDALMNIRHLLREGGVLVVFVTKQNPVTRWLAGTWWKTNLYHEPEIKRLLHSAGFDHLESKSLSAGWSNSIMVLEAIVHIDFA